MPTCRSHASTRFTRQVLRWIGKLDATTRDLSGFDFLSSSEWIQYSRTTGLMRANELIQFGAVELARLNPARTGRSH
jgi:hypothetical protein